MKYIYALKAMNKEFFKLPFSFILFMLKQMKFEKLTLHNGKIFINTIYAPFPSVSYKAALKNFQKLSRGVMSPFSVNISVTDRCHLSCHYCSNIAADTPADLTTEDLLRIIRDAQNYGVSCIGFTGGEPALRQDLEQLIGGVDERSYSILFTTGHSVDSARAKRLKETGLTAVVVSLDSHIKEEHNEKKASVKAFDEAVVAVKNCLQVGIYTAVSIVITKDMLYSGKIYDFISYVASLGVHEIRILEPKPCGKLSNTNFEFFSNNDKENVRKLQYKINKDKNLPKIMALAHINSANNYGCGAGRIYIYINAEGEVFPCDFSPLSFGNTLNESFGSIYQRMNNYFSNPSDECIISSVSKYFKECGIKEFPVRDENKINSLLSRKCKGHIPKLFSKLGFKGD